MWGREREGRDTQEADGTRQDSEWGCDGKEGRDWRRDVTGIRGATETRMRPAKGTRPKRRTPSEWGRDLTEDVI